MYGEDVLNKDARLVWNELRERWGPVAPVEVEPGVAGWLLLGYNENLHVLNNPALFSHDGRIWRELREGRVTPESGVFPMFAWRPNALHTDGTEHSRLRAAIVDGLAEMPQGQLRHDINTLAHHLVDSFIGDGEADLVSQYAVKLPLLVVNYLFGLDEDHGRQLSVLMSQLWDSQGDAVEANRQLEQYMFDLVALKHEEPGQDVTSAMLRHPNNLTDEEVAQQLMLILAAAHDPTANLIANALLVLLTDRTLRYSLASGQVLVQETIDQVLWIDPPIQTLPARYATRDVQLGNVRINAGDALILGFAPAHADPALTGKDGSEVYTPFSANKAHLVWGAGPHRCPGQSMARLITNAGIEVLARRLTGMRLSVPESELRWRPSPFSRGLVSLPVRFTPEQVSESTSSSGEATWPRQNPSSSTPTPQTSSDRQPSSASSAPSSRWNFLVRWLRGR